MTEKPMAAPFPDREGVYWVKVAHKFGMPEDVWHVKDTWELIGWPMGMALKEMRNPAYADALGHEFGVEWNGPREMVVTLGPRVDPPS